jgi:hypothetical protein
MTSRWTSSSRNGRPTLGPSGIWACRSAQRTFACPLQTSVINAFFTGLIFAAWQAPRADREQ